MKSLCAGVFWFAWIWSWAPWYRFLYSSYAQNLTTRDSVKARRLLESMWYQRNFGSVFTLTADENQKTRFSNNKTGYRLATSVKGSNTGEGGQIICVDDPLNAKERHSSLKRNECLEWWDQVMSTRLDDARTGHKVIIMQRLHDDDLSGHVLKGGGYDHLKLPAHFNPDKPSSTSIGWRDPRTQRGELLWPERFGEKELNEIGTAMGIAGRSAQLEQSPISESGSMFIRSNWKFVEALPAEGLIATVRFWDVAATEDDGAYTCGLKMNRYENGTFIITHLVRGQWSTGVVNGTIINTAQTDGAGVIVREEQEPGSAGKSVIFNRKVSLAGYDYDGMLPSGDKATRAIPLSIQQEAGNVKMLAAPWNQELIDEYEAFPYASLKDQVDAGSGAFTALTTALRRKRKARAW